MTNLKNIKQSYCWVATIHDAHTENIKTTLASSDRRLLLDLVLEWIKQLHPSQKENAVKWLEAERPTKTRLILRSNVSSLCATIVPALSVAK